MKKSVVHYLTKLIESLERQQKVVIKNQQWSDAFTMKDLQEISDTHGIELHQALVDFYLKTESFQLQWEAPVLIEKETVIIEGNINIMPLDIVLEGYDFKKWKDILWYDHDEETQKQLLKKIRPFDMFYADDTNCVCLDLNDDILGDSLLMNSNDYGIHNLNIDIEQYFEYLYITKGIVRWPFLLSKNKNLHKYKDFEKTLLDALSFLFPEEKGLQRVLVTN